MQITQFAGFYKLCGRSIWGKEGLRFEKKDRAAFKARKTIVLDKFYIMHRFFSWKKLEGKTVAH